MAEVPAFAQMHTYVLWIEQNLVLTSLIRILLWKADLTIKTQGECVLGLHEQLPLPTQMHPQQSFLPSICFTSCSFDCALAFPIPAHTEHLWISPQSLVPAALLCVSFSGVSSVRSSLVKLCLFCCFSWGR